MALISSTTIITSISLLHLTLAYFFLMQPKTVEDQALVFVLGESMNMVRLLRLRLAFVSPANRGDFAKKTARRPWLRRSKPSFGPRSRRPRLLRNQ